MKPRPVLTLTVLLLAGCSGKPAGNEAGAADATATAHAAVGVDTAYVERLLRETAFDVRECRQAPGMQGMAGAADAGEVIVAVDSSGSMVARSGEGTKMDEARMAVAQFVGGLATGTRASVVAFSDVGDNRLASKGRSCAANPRFLFGPAPVDRLAIGNAVARLRPAGWTPLASAIRAAALRFNAPDEQKRTLFVVSDGIETCGGDPVSAARDAHDKARVVVNVVGFGVSAPAEIAALTRVAAAGGGSYRAAGPGQLLVTLKAQSVAAQSANSVAVTKAEMGMQSCYLAGIAKARDALMARIEPDRAAGRINQATHARLVDASMKRFQADYDDFVRTHEANMAREQAAKAQMSGALVNAAAGN